MIATGRHLYREATGPSIFSKSKSQKKEEQNIYPPQVLENTNEKRKVKKNWINRIELDKKKKKW